MVLFATKVRVALLFLTIFLPKFSSTGLGKCPRLQYMNNFNLTRFTGRWYEIERSFYLVQIISSCLSVDLAQNSKGHLEVEVKSKSRWSGTLTVSEGLAAQKKKDPSLLTYKVVTRTLPRVLGRFLPGAGIYQVIDTDYDNYAILWTCTSYELVHTDLIWIWGRQRDLSVNRRNHIYQTLAKMDLDSDRLLLPKNMDCEEM